ncbi:MAG: universal stress protein [Pseudolysinimonas sp.]
MSIVDPPPTEVRPVALRRPALPDPQGMQVLLDQVEQSGGTVMVIPNSAPDVARSAAVVAATGHDLQTDAAISTAVALARQEGRPLILAHIWAMPDLGEVQLPPDRWLMGSIPDGQQRALALLAARIRQDSPDLVVGLEVRQSRSVSRELAAISQGAAAIVVGRRRSRSGHGRLGRTARGVIEQADCPIIVVGQRPRDLRPWPLDRAEMRLSP